MSIKKAFMVLILVATLVGLATFFNQPKERPFPFSRPLESLADYQPPGEGVTLYPTGGPFGFDVIQAIATGTDGAIYVGTFGGGLFKSDDKGLHWYPVNRGLYDKFISTLFVLEDGKVFAGTIRAGLFLSVDQGAHWISVNTGLEKTNVTTIIVLPGGDLLAGTGKGVYISRNNGGLWEPFNQGLDHTQIQSIVVTKDQTLFAGTQGIGVFKREPQGKEWFSIVNGFAFKGLEERVIRAMVLDREGALYAGTMSAGIFRSADGGSSWQSTSSGLDNLSIRTLKVDAAGVIYAGTGQGVYYSDDGGKGWISLLAGMTNVQVHSFVVNPNGDLYAGSSSGLYIGTSKTAWRPLHDNLLISPILALSYGKDRITAGTGGKGTYINHKDNWMSDNMGLVNLSIRALARGKIFLYAISNDGIYRRQVGRHQWTRLLNVPDGQAQSLGVDAADQVYLGMPDGLYSSSDHGEAWAKEVGSASEPVRAISVAGDTFFAATESTIWSKSLETGWEEIISKEGSAFEVILWREGRGLLAVTDYRIWERDLQGIWREFQGGGPEGVKIFSIAVDLHKSDVLYTGTDRGLYFSADNGISWQHSSIYDGSVFEGKINQVLTTDSSAIWLATEADGVLLGISKAARRNTLEKWTDILNDFDLSRVFSLNEKR